MRMIAPKRKYRGLLAVLLLFYLSNFVVAQKSFVSPDHKQLKYHGRVSFEDKKSPALYWSGTAVEGVFEGTALDIILDDSLGRNFYNLIVDGDEENAKVISCEKGKKVYKGFDNLKNGKHHFLLFRRTEMTEGRTFFLGLEIEGKAKLYKLPANKKRLKVEVYGNSITCGMGNLDESRVKNDDLALEDNYWAYGAIACRKLGAEYRAISRSGIGITVSWYNQIMPDIYNRLNPNNPESKWDFSIWTPDVVVVNLFQNDSWLQKRPKHPEYKRRFGNENPTKENTISQYISFVQSVRKEYPKAVIICALGSMDATREGSPWMGYIKEAVNKMKVEYKDNNIHTLFFPFTQTGGHPIVSEHKEMAEQLASFIKEIKDID